MTLFVDPYSKGQLRRQFGWVVAWIGVTGVGAFLRPSPTGHGTHEQLGLPACPSALFFDRPCPGCGLTTSWTATIHGRFAEAIHAHPLGPLMYAMFTVFAAFAAVGCYRGKIVATERPSFNRSLAAFVFVFAAFGVWRFATLDHFATSADRMSVGLR